MACRDGGVGVCVTVSRAAFCLTRAIMWKSSTGTIHKKIRWCEMKSRWHTLSTILAAAGCTVGLSFPYPVPASGLINLCSFSGPDLRLWRCVYETVKMGMK